MLAVKGMSPFDVTVQILLERKSYSTKRTRVIKWSIFRISRGIKLFLIFRREFRMIQLAGLGWIMLFNYMEIKGKLRG